MNNASTRNRIPALLVLILIFGVAFFTVRPWLPSVVGKFTGKEEVSLSVNPECRLDEVTFDGRPLPLSSGGHVFLYEDEGTHVIRVRQRSEVYRQEVEIKRGDNYFRIRCNPVRFE